MRFHAGTALIAAALALAACGNDPIVDRNEAPAADGGDDLTQPANLPVFLDGRASYDADGDQLEFHWIIDHAPKGSKLTELTEPFFPNHSTDAATTRFQPDVQGVYIVELLTYDGEFYSDPSYVIITAGRPTEIPTANAGRDQWLSLGNTATLDGGQSLDPMGGILDYRWSLVGKPYNSALDVDSIDGLDQRQASLTADQPGAYNVVLVVDNGMAESPPDNTTINFTGNNTPPEANAGGDFSAMDCEDVPLDCSGSIDADGDRLYYWWTVQASPAGSAVDNRSISNQNAASPEVFFDIAGEYQLSCSVFDGQAWSKPSTITVNTAERDYNTPPLVDAGPDKTLDGGCVECETVTSPWWPYTTTTTCDKVDPVEVSVGKSVTDPEGDPMVLEWVVTRESKARFIGAIDGVTALVQVSFPNVDKTGVTENIAYVELRATDCVGDSAKDEVEIVASVTGASSCD